MSLSQIAASHVVHLYVLALPDYHRMQVITGMEKEIGRLLRMKDVLNRSDGAPSAEGRSTRSPWSSAVSRSCLPGTRWARSWTD